MKTKFIILTIAIIVIPFLSSAQAWWWGGSSDSGLPLITGWTSDNSIVVYEFGTMDAGNDASPSAYYYNSGLHMVVGSEDGRQFTYSWNASRDRWEYPGMGTLPDIGTFSAPTAFYYNSELYIIAGGNKSCKGFKWDGSAWVIDNGIVAGLATPYQSKPTVFDYAGDMYLIHGKSGGTYAGYKWNGSSWISDTDIIVGLPDIGSNSAPCVFQYGSDLCMMSGNKMGYCYGYKWNGSSWVSDAGLSNLTGPNSYWVPTVFFLNDEWYLICGRDDGRYIGWRAIY